MCECPGIEAKSRRGDGDLPAVATFGPFKHCPGCSSSSSSQGDRLSESERGHVERIREMIVSGLGMVYPSSFDGKRLVEIIDRLAPRP